MSAFASWLDCKQFDEIDKDINTNVHIDGFRESRIAKIHHGEAFGSETPKIMSTYFSFKNHVCNTSSETRMTQLKNLQRLTMVRIMRQARTNKIFSYSRPTHLFHGHVCKILQKKVFYAPNVLGIISECPVIEIVNEAHLKRLKRYDAWGSLVIAREVAFGGPGSSKAIEEPAIWFNIPIGAIQEADISTIKMSNSRGAVQGSKDSLKHLARKSNWAPFYTYYSDHHDTCRLITGVLGLRSCEMRATLRRANFMTHEYVSLDMKLSTIFHSIKEEHLKYGWPETDVRLVINDIDSSLPKQVPYCLSERYRNRFAKKMWTSFTRNLKACGNEEIFCDDNSHPSSSRIFDFLARGQPVVSPCTQVLPKICDEFHEPLFSATFESGWKQVKDKYLQ